MVKKVELIVTVVPPEHLREEDFKIPRADWNFIDAFGNTVMLKHPDKQVCIDYVTENYGKNKYTLKPCKLKKPSGELGARGFTNSKSRAGSNFLKICAKQGRF